MVDQLMVKCTHCDHEFLAHERDTYVRKHAEDGNCDPMYVLCPECKEMTVWEESYVRDRAELPPFKCKYGPFGPEVLIGYEATGGGRWSLLNRDAEEEMQKMLQQTVDVYKGDLEGFEKSIHFVISHAVQIGWYIPISQSTMDALESVDAERRRTQKPKETYVGKLDMVACPECQSGEIVLLETSHITGRRDFNVEDGKIKPGEVYGEMLNPNGVPNFFHCRACNNTWAIPQWVEERIEW
jgi:uncharacterized protein YbaR (Trm112 family)